MSSVSLSLAHSPQAAGWPLCITLCPFSVPPPPPPGPSSLASSFPRGPSSSQTELLSSLSTPCFPKPPRLCTGCSVHLFPLSFTWLTSAHCLGLSSDTTSSGIPSPDPKLGKEPLHSHNALCFSPHSPCLHPLRKELPAPVQGSTHQGQTQAESLVPDSQPQRSWISKVIECRESKVMPAGHHSEPVTRLGWDPTRLPSLQAFTCSPGCHCELSQDPGESEGA